MIYYYSMRKDKEIAFNLRKQGKSYREIQNELGMSRATLGAWFKDVEWSKHTKHQNSNRNIALSKDRILKLNIARKDKLIDLYKKVEEEAIKEFEIFRKDPLFMAGLMIYAGEGDKRSPNNTRVSNSEFYLHKIFIKFAETYLNIDKKSIKISLLLYPDLDINECLLAWQNELGIDPGNFYKTHILKGKEPTKRLQYGVGISIISSIVVVKKKVLTWLELSKTEF